MNTNDAPRVETEIDGNSPNCFRSCREVASNDVRLRSRTNTNQRYRTMKADESTISVDQKLLFLTMYHARCQRLERYWCESLLQGLGRGMR